MGWGYNGSRCLQDVGTIQIALPVLIYGLSNVVALAAGESHEILVQRDPGASPPTVWIESVRHSSDAALELNWSGLTNRVMVDRTSVLESGDWQAVAGPQFGTVRWTIQAPTNLPQAFYRLRRY